MLLALVIRVAYAGLVLGDYRPASDAHHYHDLASSVAAGDGFAVPFPFPDDEPQPTAFRPPLYPVVLAGAYTLFGSHIGVAQGLNVVLGVGVVVLAAVLANRIAGRRAGLIAGALAAVYPPLVANDATSLAEPLGLVLLLLTVLLLLDERVVAAGAATGLQVLAKPSAQGLAVVLATWVLWRWGWRRVLSFGLPVVLVVMPWVVRNQVVLGSPVLVTSNGFNLAALYSPPSRAADAWLDPAFDPRLEAVRRDAVAAEDEIAWDRALRRVALDRLRAHPMDLLDVSAENTLRLLELTPISNEAAEVLDGRNLSLRYASLWMTWLMLPTGVIGLAILRRRPATQLLALSALYFSVVSVPFSPMPPRLRAPLDLVCCIGAAIVLDRVTRGTPSVDQPDVEPVIDLRDTVVELDRTPKGVAVTTPERSTA